MNLYSKSFQMKKKNICIILTLVMSLLYFTLGVIYADDITPVRKDNQQEANEDIDMVDKEQSV